MQSPQKNVAIVSPVIIFCALLWSEPAKYLAREREMTYNDCANLSRGCGACPGQACAVKREREENTMKNRAFYMTDIRKMEAGEAPMPVVGDEDVLVKIQAVGICGSDLHYYSRGRIGNYIVKPPFILGHEAAGVVEAVGSKVSNFKKGDRVTMEPGIPCYKCEQCLKGRYHLCPSLTFWATPPVDGCLVDYVAHPAAFTFKLPDNVSTRDGALVEPLACGLSANQRGDVQLGDTVVIFGSGCIGLVSMLVARARGASKIFMTDVLEGRLKAAEKFGAIAINSREQDPVNVVMEQTNGRGADVVLDCCGIDATIRQSLDVAALAGRIVVVGLGTDTYNNIPVANLEAKELTLMWMHRYHNQYPIALNAISSGAIEIGKIISSEYHFEDTPAAFEDCIENIQNIVKGVILY